MSILNQRGNLSTLIVALAGLVFAPLALGDDKDDVMAFIEKYGELEDDLAAQARMIRDDRVMITAVRRTDNAKNMKIPDHPRLSASAPSITTTLQLSSVARIGEKRKNADVLFCVHAPVSPYYGYLIHNCIARRSRSAMVEMGADEPVY